MVCDLLTDPVSTHILHLSIVPVDLYWKVRVSRTRFTDWNFRGVAQSLQADSGIVPRLGHCCFLPYPFKFIIHLSSYHWRYTRSFYGVVQIRHQKCNALRRFGRPAAVYRQTVLLWIILWWLVLLDAPIGCDSLGIVQHKYTRIEFSVSCFYACPHTIQITWKYPPSYWFIDGWRAW